MHLEYLEIYQEDLLLVVRSTPVKVECPVCGQPTTRAHSRYQCVLQDLPFLPSGFLLLLTLYARRTRRLQETLLQFGWVLGGEAGARLCQAHGIPIGAATFLCLLRHVEETPLPLLACLVSMTRDLAKLTQQERFSSISNVINQWMSSLVATIRCWLSGCRPIQELRSSVEIEEQVIFVERGREALDTHQVLDRWHLLKHMWEVLQRTVAQHLGILCQADQEMRPAMPWQKVSPSPDTALGDKSHKSPR